MENIDSQIIANTKTFLKRYRKNINCINRLEKKLDLLNIKLTSARTSNLSGMPRGEVPVTMEDLIADKDDLEKRIKALKDKGKRFKREILEVIDSVDDPRYCEILEGFFIECLSLEDIAENENYTVRHVYRLYHNAIETIALKRQ